MKNRITVEENYISLKERYVSDEKYAMVLNSINVKQWLTGYWSVMKLIVIYLLNLWFKQKNLDNKYCLDILKYEININCISMRYSLKGTA